MDKHEAIEIIRKGCKTIKQKEAIDLLFKHDTSIKKTDYKCKYYHKLCSRCLNWPTPEDIEKGHAEDCCVEYKMAAFYMNQEKLAETGECKYFEEL